MSRGFVKEGDQEEVPLVPPRAYLPAGVINYVTPMGLELLHNERNELISERNALNEQDKDKNRVQVNYINSKLNLLDERINSSKLVDLSKQNKEIVHFGAKVTVNEDNKCTVYQIVGVDEADLSSGKISFISPMAKVLINKKIGESILLKTPKGNRTMIIENIEYL